jgi:osmoprotectant transport system ATP-binding protein
MVLRVSALAKTFGGEVEAVRDVSFEVGPGELVALVGESGCGKTTTLKCINRLLEPSSGTILVEGEDIQAIDPVALRRRIGWVMQGDGLFPHLSASANITVTPRLLGWDKADISTRVDELLELVRLDPDEFRDRLPAQMSGGQRQRVGVARALAARSNLILMDEPFGALDPITRDGLREDVMALKAKLNFAAVLVTHDMAEALLTADRIAVMDQGRVVQYGTPADLLAAPAGPLVERMLETPLREARRVRDLTEGAGHV